MVPGELEVGLGTCECRVLSREFVVGSGEWGMGNGE